jgi:hypothetical protein
MNFDQISKLIKDNSPTLISGAAVVGVITTAVLTARASRKATLVLVDDNINRGEKDGQPAVWVPDRSRREVFDLTWKLYIPPVLSGAATIGCIVWANRIGLQRNAALIAAAALADTAFREYKDEIVRTLGEKEHDKVEDRISEKRMAENPPPSREVLLLGAGEQTCYDRWSGRYFRSNMESIRQAVNDLNKGIIDGNMYADLNEFYGLVGLDPIDGGEPVGWNVDNMCDVGFTSHLSSDGTACLCVYFRNVPKVDFGKTF